VAAQRTVLDAIISVFDYTAREMEQYPRLMFEIIAYIAHATEPPHPPSLTRAELLLAFPDLPGAEDVEPQSIDELFTAQLKQSVRVGELPFSLSTEAVALLLKTVFYGVPLATRREVSALFAVPITRHWRSSWEGGEQKRDALLLSSWWRCRIQK
jgi:hypothetical protein